MKLSICTARPCTLPRLPTPKCVFPSVRCSAAEPVNQMPKPPRLGKRWKDYQGFQNWEGLLDPLDNNLRREIIRYGKFVDVTYKAFDFDPSSPSYATCLFPKRSLFNDCGLPGTGYRLTKNLHATSGIRPPRWFRKAPNWMSNRTSWIGYMAVCQDEDEIARLGRRDVVIAYRGTATCLEWLENLRATLTHIPDSNSILGLDLNKCNDKPRPNPMPMPMVGRGFLSLYMSGTAEYRSLQDEVREEIGRLIQSYGDEPLSLTITGHSLGAALATLTAYDITTTFRNAPPVTVISFGAPRVGNSSFRCDVEKSGSKILRIVNSEDPITKVPGFVMDEMASSDAIQKIGFARWLQAQWDYADVGTELRVSSRDSPDLCGPTSNVATCHHLDTYLHLVNGFVSSKCPFRKTRRQPPLTKAVG